MSDTMSNVTVLHAAGGRRASGLHSGASGGGGDGSMEHRVSRLEADVTDIKQVLQSLAPAIERIDERLGHVPSSKELFIHTFAILAIVIGLFAVTAANIDGLSSRIDATNARIDALIAQASK